MSQMQGVFVVAQRAQGQDIEARVKLEGAQRNYQGAEGSFGDEESCWEGIEQ